MQNFTNKFLRLSWTPKSIYAFTIVSKEHNQGEVNRYRMAQLFRDWLRGVGERVKASFIARLFVYPRIHV